MSGSKVVALVIPAVLVAAVAGVGVGVKYREPLLRAAGVQMAMAQPVTTTSPAATEKGEGKVVYTCAMHPQIRLDKPGLCPICHMELTPLHVGAHLDNPSRVTVDPVIVQNMGLRMGVAEEGELPQGVRAVGTLTEPEQNHVDVNLRVAGWVQKLYANQEGMQVKKGDALLELYSPEITAAADELIAARKSAEEVGKSADPILAKSTAMVLAAGKRKLELLGLTEEQVEEIAKMEKAPATVTIRAPRSGHIAEKKVIEGAAVTAGQQLFEIADRSSMWLQVQVYEQQLGLVSVGQKAKVSVPAVPGVVYEGTVDFVYPHLDSATRTATVRVVLENHDHQLHENMYGTAELAAPPTAASVLVPREAVIDSGLKQVVFVAEGDGKFMPRQVALGRTGRREAHGAELVQVLSGLKPGEQIVTSGQFLLDSESRMQEATAKFLAVGNGAGGAATQPEVVVAAKGEVNPRVTEVLRAYLPLAAFFGAPQTSATPARFEALKNAAEGLGKDEDEVVKKLGGEIVALLAPAMEAPIDQQREAFKAVSQKVVGLVNGRALAPGLGTVYVFECPMDNARWLQQTPMPANPFFPVVMKTCGEKKGAIEPTGTPATAPATAPVQGGMQ